MKTLEKARPQLFKTKNDLNENVRHVMAALLNERLADTVDLATQCKQAHWNVKGPNFIALHKLFDDVHHDVAAYSDLLAERAAQLGAMAMGTVRQASLRSTLDEYPPVLEDQDHVEALSSALAQYGEAIRSAIDTAAQSGDADTADIFTEISRGTDKWLWFVESHKISATNPT